jgi:class 3 adenylate cyclase
VDRLNLLLFSNRIHKVLQAVYEKQGKYHEAFIHQKLYYAYKDSLGNGELTKQRVQTELKQAFEQEKNKKELETQKRLATQRLYLYLSLLGLLGAILIGFFILRSRRKINQERAKSDKLLLNILPAETANELKEKGSATPKHYDLITVLFTDFKGFTNIAEKMTPTEVIENLNTCFYALDLICDKYGLEKIKTIGDSYMCAGGLPIANTTNPIDVVSAGLEMQEWMAGWIAGKRANGQEVWELRLGIHSGEAVAGVVGKNKFAYDIWGDTVNLASRMESSGEVGKVNISGATYELVKDKFVCTHRGAVKAKNKGEVEMYFVEEAITS